jgi:HD-GYP domain-containing protein (c-di-GMP phosphodiesterase class II)
MMTMTSVEAEPTARKKHFEWRSRRVASNAIRVVVVLVPIIAAVASSMFLGRVLPQATAKFWILSRLVAIIVGSSLAMIQTTKLMQRLLPLAVLLKVTLAFPDAAPSRFKVALRHRVSTGRRATEQQGDDGASAVTAELVSLLQRLSKHHRLTRGHSERVRAYADLIAEQLSLPDEDRRQLRWAALLHDIGKIEVPVEVLDLPGRPSAEQWVFIANHPAEGETLAEPIKGWLGDYAPGIWQHHERWDGKGYPRKLAGTDISLAGRIVALADAFETMTATRSYKTPMTIEAGREELVKCAGAHFDPEIVRAFLRVSIGSLRGVVGIAALFNAPLMFISQFGEFGKLLLRTSSAGAVAGVAVVSGVAGDVGAAKPIPTVVPVVVTATTSTTTQAPIVTTATTTTIVRLPLLPQPPTTVPETTTTEAPSTTSPPTTVRRRPTATIATATTTEPTTTTTTEPAPATTPTQTTTTKPTRTVAPTTTVTPTTTLPPTTTTAAPATTVPLLIVNADSVTVDAGVFTTISPLANDSGFDRSTLTVTSRPPGTIVSVNVDGTLTIRPALGHAGNTETIGYQVCGAAGLCASATITVSVV